MCPKTAQGIDEHGYRTMAHALGAGNYVLAGGSGLMPLLAMRWDMAFDPGSLPGFDMICVRE